jgi:hypothetical protein
VVRGRAIGAELGELGAAQQVAAADDDRDLDAEPETRATCRPTAATTWGATPTPSSPRLSPLIFSRMRLI